MRQHITRDTRDHFQISPDFNFPARLYYTLENVVSLLFRIEPAKLKWNNTLCWQRESNIYPLWKMKT